MSIVAGPFLDRPSVVQKRQAKRASVKARDASRRASARGTGATTGSTAMTGLIVGMPLRASIGTEALTIENHSSGLLNNTSARLARTLFHLV